MKRGHNPFGRVVKGGLLLALSALMAIQPTVLLGEATTGVNVYRPAALSASGQEDDTFYPDDGVVPTQAGVEEDTDPVFIIHYEEVAQNNLMVMYADKATGLFAVKNKKTGKIWYSTPRDSLLDTKTKGKAKMNLQSQLLVYFIYREDENTNIDVQMENSQVACINRGTIKTELIENGIRVLYDFQNQGIQIPVEYTLQGDCFSARIDFENLVEGDKCYLVAIHLLPTMGAGNWEEEGYLFIPDGSGAIVNFNNNVSMPQNYEVPVYGENLGMIRNTQPSRSQNIHMPVIGTVTGGDALMGIVTQGDAAATICVYNGNDSTGYNAVSTKCVLREHEVVDSFYVTNRTTDILQISHTPYTQEAYEVCYYPLSGEEASYVGMAGRYRDYLEARGMTKNPRQPALALDVYGAVPMKANFLGITYTKTEALTTFEQTQAILEDLKAKGVERLSVRYRGWGGNGLLNKRVPTKASPLGLLGGKKGFSALQEFCSQEGISFYPEVDLLRFLSGGGAAKAPAGEDALQYEYLLSVYETKLTEKPLKLLAPSRLVETAESYFASYAKLEQPTIALDFIGSGIFSDFNEKNGVHKGDLPLIYEQVLQSGRNNGLKQAFEGGNAYVLPYADYIYEAPIYSSGYDIFAQDVPFYQIVLHGYVGMTVPEMVQSVEPEVTFLKAAETGCELLYACIDRSADSLTGTRFASLYGSTYALWGDSAAEQYQRLYGLLDRVYDQTIVGHEKLADNVFMTTYENGIRVVVNYSETPYTYEGTTVSGMDFMEVGETDA